MTILKTAVGSGKVMQDFESELVPTEGHIPQVVKGPSIGNDSDSKDCVNLPLPTAVFRLRAKQLTKTFTSPSTVSILKGIDLEVGVGEAVAIVGKSGEGKSTLLHILGTLERPCSGSLQICGLETKKHACAALRNTHIGFIFQHCHLLDHETLLSNVLMPCRIARKNTAPLYARALQLLESVGLKERAHFPARLLSGGEKQRAAIARALCNDPPLILADEPSGDLDSAHSQEVHTLLIRLVKECNKSLVVVTHDPKFASLCDRTLLLKDGLLTPLVTV